MDTRFWCPRGGTGAAAAGHERRITAQPGEWRQVARWSGLVAPVLRALFSFPAVGRAPGWVGRWFCGRSGRSGLPRPRAACGASRRTSFPWQSECERQGVLRSAPAQTNEWPPGRIRL